MKFRRKPVDRDVIDAVKLTLSYVFVSAAGDELSMPHDEFEALYEPVVRKRSTKATPARKPRKPRKPRAGAMSPPQHIARAEPADDFDRQPTPAGFMPI